MTDSFGIKMVGVRGNILRYFARVAELADAPDLGSGGQPWGFDSPLSHQISVYSAESVHKVVVRTPQMQ